MTSVKTETAIYPNGETREQATARVNACYAENNDEFHVPEDDEMQGRILAKDVVAKAQARMRGEYSATQGGIDDRAA